jgi:DNA invertase Pin-like site-specific DNA recombinase
MQRLYAEGLTYREIGLLYNVKPQTVWKQLNKKDSRNGEKKGQKDRKNVETR